MKFRFKQIALAALLGALASGCASVPADPYGIAAAISPEQALTLSTEAMSAGQGEKALAILTVARKTNPANKELWLKSAQLNFETTNYVQAISDAQEVLLRDAGDRTAQSIIVVSGLRLSTKAIAELVKAESLDGSTKSEAEKLARSLRESLGEIVLVPSPQPSAARPAANPPRRQSKGGNKAASDAAKPDDKPAKAAEGCPAGNPFCGL